MDDHRDWTLLANKIYTKKVEPVDALFVHGWGDLTEEMIKLVAKLYNETKAKFIIINGAKEYEIGSPGADYWQEQLSSKYSVSSEAILTTESAPHTHKEAEGFLDLAAMEDIKSALVVTVPQHIVRAFLTNLGEAQSRKMDIKLVPQTLQDVNWTEEIEIAALISDKIVTSRLARLFGEFSRMVEYRKFVEEGHDDFNIASVSQGLNYLNSL